MAGNFLNLAKKRKKCKLQIQETDQALNGIYSIHIKAMVVKFLREKNPKATRADRCIICKRITK